MSHGSDGRAQGEQAGDMERHGSAGKDDGDDQGGVRLTAWVRGQVQGVGFRWWTRCRALELGLTGSAANLVDGRVEVIAQGRREAAERLLALLAPEAPAPHHPRARRPGRVDGVAHQWGDPQPGIKGFVER
jgi:acylphosphatase